MFDSVIERPLHTSLSKASKQVIYGHDTATQPQYHTLWLALHGPHEAAHWQSVKLIGGLDICKEKDTFRQWQAPFHFICWCSLARATTNLSISRCSLQQQITRLNVKRQSKLCRCRLLLGFPFWKRAPKCDLFWGLTFTVGVDHKAPCRHLIYHPCSSISLTTTKFVLHTLACFPLPIL